VAVNDIYLLRCVARMPGQTAFNVSYWRSAGETAPVPAISTIVAQFETRFFAAYKGLMPTVAEWRGCGLRKIRPAPPTPESFNVTHAGPGDLASAPLPTQTCGLITLLTAFSGRKFRGRKYIPFPTEEDNTADAAPVATYVTRLNALKDFFTTTLSVAAGGGSIDLAPVIYHRATQTDDLVIGGRSATVWATQRRRGAFHAGDLLPF
jgi:hypothetical protein